MSFEKTRASHKSKTIQSTIECFTNKAKSSGRRKEKAKRKRIENEESGKDDDPIELSTDGPERTVYQRSDISLLPQYLTKRPDVMQPTAIHPYSNIIPQLKDGIPMGATCTQDMVAN